MDGPTDNRQRQKDKQTIGTTDTQIVGHILRWTEPDR